MTTGDLPLGKRLTRIEEKIDLINSHLPRILVLEEEQERRIQSLEKTVFWQIRLTIMTLLGFIGALIGAMAGKLH